VPRIGLQLTPFNALDEISQYSIGTTRQTDLLGLAHDQAVEDSISVRRPFCMSWPFEGRCSAAVRFALNSPKNLSGSMRFPNSGPNGSGLIERTPDQRLFFFSA
jgi:hypothetical protein